MPFLLCGTVWQQGELLSLSGYSGFQGHVPHLINTKLVCLHFVRSLLASVAELSWLCCSPLLVLQQEVPKVVKSLNKQLREKSVKTKVNFEHFLCPNSGGFVKSSLEGFYTWVPRRSGPLSRQWHWCWVGSFRLVIHCSMVKQLALIVTHGLGTQYAGRSLLCFEGVGDRVA